MNRPTMPMNRRKALAALGLVLGYGSHAQAASLPPGLLTVDLNQYKAIRVRYGQDDYYVDPAEVWRALKDE
jgi:hypothetical protein